MNVNAESVVHIVVCKALICLVQVVNVNGLHLAGDVVLAYNGVIFEAHVIYVDHVRMYNLLLSIRENGSTNHKSKCVLIDHHKVWTNTMVMNLRRTEVKNTNEAKGNEDIANNGSRRQLSDLSDPTQGDDDSKNNPYVVFRSKRTVTVVHCVNNNANVFRNKDHVRADKADL